MDSNGKYLMYLRKSRSDDEAGIYVDDPLTRHRRLLTETAAQMNVVIAEAYEEIATGDSIEARPQMQRLLSEVELGVWDGIFVMELERLARGDSIDQGIVMRTFKYSGTKIITPLKIYDLIQESDEEYVEFGLFMSRREYKIINRRMQRGRIASIKEGHFVANKPPYGYARVKLEKQRGFSLKPVPKEAEVVRLIYSIYLSGVQKSDGSTSHLGYVGISRRLNEFGYRTREGSLWKASGVQSILNNPVYIGKIRWGSRPSVKTLKNGVKTAARPRISSDNWLLTDGLHEAIVTPEQFNAIKTAQKDLNGKSLNCGKALKNPFAGLLRCSKCGRAMIRQPLPARNVPDDDYRKVLISCPNPCCDCSSSYFSYVEERILNSLSAWLETYEIALASDKKSMDTSQKEKDVAKYKQQTMRLEMQLSKAREFLEIGVYSVDEFIMRRKKLEQEIVFIKSEIFTLNLEIEQNKERQAQKLLFIPRIKHILDIYFRLDSAQAKNDLLKEILDHIVYAKDKQPRSHPDPYAFTITLFPKLPPDL